MTWNQLVDSVKDNFRYQSPLDDNYEILHDIVQQEGEEEVHSYIKSELEHISLSEPVLHLARQPWFATFTTNYDTALEDALKQREDVRARTIIDSGKFVLSNSPTHLLCVKLMGSITADPGESGSMVLTRSDRERAKDERSRMFDMLGSHASELSILFVGYSFTDGIFSNILEQITTKSGVSEGSYYALCKSNPDEKQQYRLDQMGVQPIVADISDFAEELNDRVAARDTSNYRTKSIPIGKDAVRVPTEEIGSFLDSYEPVLNERFRREVSPKEFYRGNSDGLKPFTDNWHFSRKEEESILKQLTSREAGYINVHGQPGSGRSFIISSVVEQMIRENRAIAIDTPSHKWSSVPYADELTKFIRRINSRANREGINPPESVVIFSKTDVSSEDISRYEFLKDELDIPVYLISESVKPVPSDVADGFVMNQVVEEEIPERQRDQFIEYLTKITSKHNLVGVNKDRAKLYISKEPNFLPVMYRSIFQTKKSIQNIILDEYESIDSSKAERLVDLCALSTYFDIRVPVTVCRRYLNHVESENINWESIFSIKKEAQSLITETVDADGAPLFGIYHPIVAQHLCNRLNKNIIDNILMDIAESVSLTSKVESDFVGELMIKRGVKSRSESDLPFSYGGLEDALERLAERQPARPILHHLAILKQDLGRDEDEFIPLLEKALGDETKKFESYERVEHILVTLANLQWKSVKESEAELQVSDERVQEIFSKLVQSRQVEYNPNSYHVQARIYRDLAENEQGKAEFKLLNNALDLLDEALARFRKPEDRDMLHSLKVKILGEFEEDQARELAEKIKEQEGSGEGYYTLARLQLYGEKNYGKALIELDEAMDAQEYPAGAIELRIKILLEDNYEQYDKMLSLVRELDSRGDFDHTWDSLYRKATVLAINGIEREAKEAFDEANYRSPRYIRQVQHFWMENHSRKKFVGTIKDMTSSEGFIHNHNVPKWTENIYFTPGRQTEEEDLMSGLDVEFELGFSLKGPQAFELELI